MDLSQYRVAPGSAVDLSAWPTDDHGGWDRGDAEERTDELNDRLEELQELLYAEGEHKVLVVIQATDTGGKDGTIRHVFDKVNPQGVTVASFKRPTERELAHDYLWRVHRHTPGAGQLTIFNRSHYEDVLVVRVHELVPETRWRRRLGGEWNFHPGKLTVPLRAGIFTEDQISGTFERRGSYDGDFSNPPEAVTGFSLGSGIGASWPKLAFSFDLAWVRSEADDSVDYSFFNPDDLNTLETLTARTDFSSDRIIASARFQF